MVILKNLILRELSEGLTEAELAASIGVPKRTITSILDGNSPRDIEKWKRFAAYFRMDVDLLRFGELKLPGSHRDLLSRDPVTEVSPFRGVPLIAWKHVPQVIEPGASFAAIDAEAMIETDVSGPRVFALRVKDDTMEPLFRKEEIIFVNPDLCWQQGHYVLVLSQSSGSEEGTIRQLKKSGHQYILHALNPKHPDSLLTERDKIVGRVVRLRMNL